MHVNSKPYGRITTVALCVVDQNKVIKTEAVDTKQKINSCHVGVGKKKQINTNRKTNPLTNSLMHTQVTRRIVALSVWNGQHPTGVSDCNRYLYFQNVKSVQHRHLYTFGIQHFSIHFSDKKQHTRTDLSACARFEFDSGNHRAFVRSYNTPHCCILSVDVCEFPSIF